MNALECIEKISNTSLIGKNLKYCLVDENKHPIKTDGEFARPNKIEDFVDLIDLLEFNDLSNYKGVGISIQASQVCAIDIDHCFLEANNILTISENAKQILEKFKNKSYCEFSFSGTGLRILFEHPIIENYSEKYYIKNKDVQIEFYQPSNSFRYVTITGNYIYDNFSVIDDDILCWFLDTFMEKSSKNYRKIPEIKDNLAIDALKNKTRLLYLTNSSFQDLWFSKAPGSGKNESERDFRILCYLFEYITQDPNKLKELFEDSPFFKSKDWKHIHKWEYQDFRYFKYVYEQIRKEKLC